MTGGWHALPETIARGREEGQHGGAPNQKMPCSTTTTEWCKSGGYCEMKRMREKY